MRFNPALRELGFGPTDRVVVVHADDVGMCGATVDSFFDLLDVGVISSGSAMVPCPWFPAVAARCRERADVDVGVHLTLTCEWDGYRWGPISTRDPASGLLDDEGYLFRRPQLWRRPDLQAVAAEMASQVDRALAAGLDLTHVDCHMFAILSPELADPYVEVGLARRLPVFLTRQPEWVEILSEADDRRLGGARAAGLRPRPIHAARPAGRRPAGPGEAAVRGAAARPDLPDHPPRPRHPRAAGDRRRLAAAGGRPRDLRRPASWPTTSTGSASRSSAGGRFANCCGRG